MGLRLESGNLETPCGDLPIKFDCGVLSTPTWSLVSLISVLFSVSISLAFLCIFELMGAAITSLLVAVDYNQSCPRCVSTEQRHLRLVNTASAKNPTLWLLWNSKAML